MGSRVRGNMNRKEIIGNMSDGCEKAKEILEEIMDNELKVDPKSDLAFFGTVIFLDENRIYGEDIVRLHDDVCNKNIVAMQTLMKANREKIIFKKDIKDMMQGEKKFNFIETLNKIQEKYPEFAEGKTEIKLKVKSIEIPLNIPSNFNIM